MEPLLRKPAAGPESCDPTCQNYQRHRHKGNDADIEQGGGCFREPEPRSQPRLRWSPSSRSWQLSRLPRPRLSAAAIAGTMDSRCGRRKQHLQLRRRRSRGAVCRTGMALLEARSEWTALLQAADDAPHGHAGGTDRVIPRLRGSGWRADEHLSLVDAARAGRARYGRRP